MSRYIDADGIDIRAREGYDHDGVLYIPYRDVRKSLDAAPSIDIVLCQDCKHYEDPDHKIFENCVKWKEPHGIILPMKPNDSCSYGERVDKYEKEYRELGLGKLKALRQTEREGE